MKIRYFAFCILLLAGCGDELDRTNRLDANAAPEVQAPARIAGTLQLEGETDSSGVSIRLRGSTDRDILTNADGSFVADDLVPGTYTITVAYPGFEGHRVSDLHLVPATDITLSDVVLPVVRAALQGSVSMEDPTVAIAGTLVQLVRTAGARADAAAAPGFRAAAETASTLFDPYPLQRILDSTGQYTFGSVPVGTWLMTVSRDGVAPAYQVIQVGTDGSVTPPEAVQLQALSGDFEIVGKLADGTASNMYTAQEEVEVKLAAVNAETMRIGQRSGSEACAYEAAEDFAVVRAVELQGDDGVKQVCVQYFDSRGNQTAELVAAIVLDRTAPTLNSIRANGGKEYAVDKTLVLEIVGYDLGSGLAKLERQRNGTDLGTIDYLPVFDDTVLGDGTYVYAVVLQDKAGNRSVALQTAIQVDSQAPVIDSFQVNSGITEVTASLFPVSVSASDASPMQLRIWFDDENSSAYQGFVTQMVLAAPVADGVYSIGIRLRDAAGNESEAQSRLIEIDTTPPDVPDLVVTDLDGDGYALSSSTVELTWTDIAAADDSVVQYELQRIVVGSDSAFSTIAVVSSMSAQYVDDVTLTAGKVHQYRVRSEDDKGIVSAWSAIAEARPFDPIASVDWIRASTGDIAYFFPPAEGTFQLLPSYEYTDINFTEYRSVFLSNIIEWTRPASYFDARYNEYLILQTSNQDNSLVQESRFLTDLNRYSEIDTFGRVGQDLQVARDGDGYFHLAYYDSNVSGLVYTTNRSGTWERTVVDNVGTAGRYADIAVTPDGIPHIAYSHFGPDDLYYATMVSGVWQTELILSAGKTGLYNAIALDSQGAAHIVTFKDTDDSVWYADNTTGSWRTWIVETGAFNLARLDIAIDEDDASHFTYLDYNTNTLRYVNNTSGSWVTQDVGFSGQMGLALGIDSKGKIHITGREWPNLYYVTNKSGSWVEAAFPFDAIDIANLAFDAEDNLFMLVGDFPSFLLTNESGSWVTSEVDAVYSQYTSVFLDEDRTAHMFYRHSDAEDVVYRVDSRYQQIARPVTNNATLDMAVHEDADGTMHIVYASNAERQYMHAVRENGVWMQEEITRPERGYHRPSIAFGPDDAIHMVWESRFPSTYLNYGTNAGGSWFFEKVGNNGDDVFDIAVDSAGRPHVFTNSQNTEKAMYLYRDGGGWVSEIIQGPWTHTPYLFAPTIAIGPDDVVHLFIEVDGDGSYYANNATGSWGWEFLGPIDTNGGGTEMIVAPDGTVHLVYTDNNISCLNYAVRTGGSWATKALDCVEYARSPDMVLDENGAVHIVFGDYTLYGMHALQYMTNAPGRWFRAIIDDSDWDVAENTAVTIDHNGVLHAAYAGYDEPLRYATGFNGTLQAESIELASPF